jgi:hypothetical protein
MALKSTTTPLDQHLLTEWRTQVCGIKGIDYDSMPTAWQTLFGDTVNRAFEYLSQRAGHHPWGQQETTLSVVAGTDQTFSMPAAMRHVIAIHEVATDGSILQVNLTEKRKYYETPIIAAGAHPWTLENNPYWFFDGLTSAEPPVQQWRRVGDANSGATAYVLFRPYFNLLSTSGQDAYPYLPASESSALLHRILSQLAAAEKDWTGAQFHKAMMDDEIAALEVNDRDTVEAPRRLGVDPDFARQMG